MLQQMWSELGGSPDRLEALELADRGPVLPSLYRVTELAAACVSAATLAVAELAAVRGGPAGRVRVDSAHAAVAFHAEARQRPQGWSLPPVWDPLAGDYRCADGHLRLHTNYAHHREAALAALGVPAEREAVARALAGRARIEVEQAVVDHGGCAAAMRTRAEWLGSGAAPVDEPLVAWDRAAGAAPLPPGDRPLEGVRVLDLTRVLAGPVATRVLAAWGADVLRVDPPGFEEVGAIVPEMSAGKRCAVADLRDRDLLARLVAQADVLVVSLRPGASVAVDTGWLRSVNPSLTVVRHAAWGWQTPWSGRRGFDSLVQMACGVCARGMEVRGGERPVPLPVQALDHGTGWLMAAAACRALTRRQVEGVACEARLSLARTAELLVGAGAVDHLQVAPPGEVFLERAETAWGPIDRVGIPGEIGAWRPRLERAAGPLGRDGLGWSASTGR